MFTIDLQMFTKCSPFFPPFSHLRSPGKAPPRAKASATKAKAKPSKVAAAPPAAAAAIAAEVAPLPAERAKKVKRLGRNPGLVDDVDGENDVE